MYTFSYDIVVCITKQIRSFTGRLLHRRWKSLRDCYRREVSKQQKTKSGSGATGRKPYIYFEQLRFLQPVTNITESSMEQEQEDDDEETVEQHRSDTASQQTLTQRSKRRKQKDDDDKLIDVLKMRVAQGGPSTLPTSDPDTLFMLSLVPEIQKVPEDRKLFLKSQLIDAILKAQSQPLQFTHVQLHRQPVPQMYNQPPSYSQNFHLPGTSTSYPPTFTPPLPPQQPPSCSSHISQQTQLLQAKPVTHQGQTNTEGVDTMSPLSASTDGDSEPFVLFN